MARKRFSVEQIINHLREADVFLVQARTVGEVCRRTGVTEQSYYRWRKEYGGLKVGQARRLKDLRAENARLKRAIEGAVASPACSWLRSSATPSVPQAKRTNSVKKSPVAAARAENRDHEIRHSEGFSGAKNNRRVGENRVVHGNHAGGRRVVAERLSRPLEVEVQQRRARRRGNNRSGLFRASAVAIQLCCGFVGNAW